MTIKELLKKYKRKYPGVPYEIYGATMIVSKKGQYWHSYNDAPAIIFLDGEEENWYKNGKRHREDDKPAVIHSNGKIWYKNGKRHRENDKPAFIWSNGEKEYWYHGEEYVLFEKNKKQINKLTPKKSSKQKQREDLLKEFTKELLNTQR